MELTRPFAENGDRQDFPVDIQGDGTMSLEQGFGALFGKPPEEGGYFIDRMKFNQLMYLTTKGVIENKTSIEALESEYGSLVTSSAKLLTENLTWNVGSGGDYEDLQTAINEASKYLNCGNFTITINLKSDYILQDTIYINNMFIPFVKISSENSNLTINVSNFNNKSCFIAHNSFLPTIDFNCDLQNKQGTGGLLLITQSFLKINQGKTFKNNSNDVLILANSSNIFCNSNTFENNKTAIFCDIGGYIDVSNSTFNNNDTSISSSRNSYISVTNSTLNNSTTYGCIAGNGGLINASSANVNQNQGTCFHVYGSSQIGSQSVNYGSSSATKTNQAVNTVTANGIIFG